MCILTPEEYFMGAGIDLKEDNSFLLLSLKLFSAVVYSVIIYVYTKEKKFLLFIVVEKIKWKIRCFFSH